MVILDPARTAGLQDSTTDLGPRDLHLGIGMHDLAVLGVGERLVGPLLPTEHGQSLLSRAWANNAQVMANPSGTATASLLGGSLATAVALLDGLGLVAAFAHGLQVARIQAGAALGAATPNELQVVLGHSSAGFSLTQYGHIFDADPDRVADRLDALLDPRTGQGRDRTGETLVQLPARTAE
jgi:hypothetical protein